MCGFSEGDDDYQSDYDVWLEHLEETSRMGEEHLVVVWRRKVSATGKEMSSIISTAQTAVRLFASKDVQRLTNVDTFAMDGEAVQYDGFHPNFNGKAIYV